MGINNNELQFSRILDLEQIKGSAFLFGPRMTGKTSLLTKINASFVLDLLNPDNEVFYRAQPHAFYESIQKLKKNSRVIVDEIQRVPALLDFVQMGIEKHGLNFFLSGSSARKLKRGAANLLGGRAADLKLHSLTADETGEYFDLERALTVGCLPKIVSLDINKNYLERDLLLKSYVTTYIKEEVQAEAIVRNLEAFQRFLPVAAQSNAQMIEYSNISRACSVHMNTVKEYYTILEDTLIGFLLWPLDRSERKKARPKFYFFDCGALRALQGMTGSQASQMEKGFLFETWFINEIRKHRDYLFREHELSLWRQDKHEIDLVISGPRGPLLAFELKYGDQPGNLPSIFAFKSKFPKTPIFIVSASSKIKTKRTIKEAIDIISWQDAIEIYKNL